MSLSDDDEDFLSADEDAFDHEPHQEQAGRVLANRSINNQLAPTKELNKHKDQKPVDTSSTGGEFTGDKQSLAHTKISSQESSKLAQKVDRHLGQLNEIGQKEEHRAQEEQEEEQDDVPQDEEDEEDEAQAERIRERNLMITRKFSNELVERVLKSAPIPTPSSALHVPGRDRAKCGSENSPDKTEATFPPAPPPTPALSSSPSSSAVMSELVKGSSQYGWRLPPAKQVTRAVLSSGGVQKTPQPNEPEESKSHQARLALDRLSDNLSKQREKSLFDMVAEDIKKVAIRGPTDNSEVAQTDPGVNEETIPSLVELGSSLGSWGWSNASKLLSSATKVTSEVTSQVSSQVNAILTPTEVKKDNKQG